MLVKNSNSSGNMPQIKNHYNSIPRLGKEEKVITRLSKPKITDSRLKIPKIIQRDSKLNNPTATKSNLNLINQANSEENIKASDNYNSSSVIKEDKSAPFYKMQNNGTFYQSIYEKYQTLNKTDSKAEKRIGTIPLKAQFKPIDHMIEREDGRETSKDLVKQSSGKVDNFNTAPNDVIKSTIEDKKQIYSKCIPINKTSFRIENKHNESSTNPFRQLLRECASNSPQENVLRANNNLPKAKPTSNLKHIVLEQGSEIMKLRRKGVCVSPNSKSNDELKLTPRSSQAAETQQDNEGSYFKRAKSKKKGLLFCCF